MLRYRLLCQLWSAGLRSGSLPRLGIYIRRSCCVAAYEGWAVAGQNCMHSLPTGLRSGAVHPDRAVLSQWLSCPEGESSLFKRLAFSEIVPSLPPKEMITSFPKIEMMQLNPGVTVQLHAIFWVNKVISHIQAIYWFFLASAPLC